MEQDNFFTSMDKYNRLAFIFFILAKISGFIGACIGFMDSHRAIGGFLLWGAFIFVGLSVICSMIQFSIDKKKFIIEDQERTQIRELKTQKRKIEEEIKKLKEKQLSLEKLMINRN